MDSRAADTDRTIKHVISVPIDVLCWAQTVKKIAGWAERSESRYVCVCNVHSLVTALQRDDVAQAISRADMATPDGAPVAWMLRRLGTPSQRRINGPDLMERLCEMAAAEGLPIFLHGSTNETLSALSKRLKAAHPALKIAGTQSPPFRPLTDAEEAAQLQVIRDSGAKIVFVSLGCPKQETWMAKHRGSVNAVMLGVGAAFDFHAGTVSRAPHLMQALGLEWLHRLCSEPRRLWKRYLVTNTVFMWRAAKQLLGRNHGIAERCEVPH